MAKKSSKPKRQEQEPHVLFCNIAWMASYDRIAFPEDRPRYGGSYVKDTGDAFESWNFHKYDDGYYGFVETKYRGGTSVQARANQLHIEKIDPSAKGETVDGITVVFCAYSDEERSTVIVGWYEDATVLRRRKQHPDGHMYNIKAPYAILLPEAQRTKKIPRAKGGNFGFGQSNIRFAEEPLAGPTKKEVLAYIKSVKTSLRLP